jgi:hypothetical protein
MTMAKNRTAISDVIASGVMPSCRAWPDNKRDLSDLLQVTLNFGLPLGPAAKTILHRSKQQPSSWRAGRGSYCRWASPHRSRWLVLPFAQVHDLSQQAVFGPRQIAHLNHHLRPDPMHP